MFQLKKLIVYNNSIFEAYQSINGTKYFPTKSGLRFLDVYGNLLSTDNSTLNYTTEKKVDETSSKRIISSNPNGANIIEITSYYDNNQVNQSTHISEYFGNVGIFTDVFDCNISRYDIGYELARNYIVTGSATYHGLDVWEIKNKEIPYGYQNYSYLEHIEKTTGLVVDYNYTFLDDNNLTGIYTSDLVSQLQFVGSGNNSTNTNTNTITNSDKNSSNGPIKIDNSSLLAVTSLLAVVTYFKTKSYRRYKR